MSKNLITNPITGKFIRKSSQRVINSVIENFESRINNNFPKKNISYKPAFKEINMTDKEFFEKHYNKI